MRRQKITGGVIAALTFVATAGAVPSAAQPAAPAATKPAAPGAVDARVRTLVDAYAAAWNANDMGAMAALYAPNVHWVNIVGMHWQGKADVDRAHRIYFDLMFKDVPIALEAIEAVVPLPAKDGSGGAVAVVRWKMGAFTTPAGQRNPPSRDRMTLVLVPEGDRLVIAHGANIQIVEAAQQHDPIAAGPPPPR